jgi:hypothetical protein
MSDEPIRPRAQRLRYTYSDFVRGVVPGISGYLTIGEKPNRDHPHGRVRYRNIDDGSITDDPGSRRVFRVIDGGGSHG